MKGISQDDLCSSRDSNRVPVRYESTALQLSLSVAMPASAWTYCVTNMTYVRGLADRGPGSSWEMPGSSVDLQL
jgi:hypothetical protein